MLGVGLSVSPVEQVVPVVLASLFTVPVALLCGAFVWQTIPLHKSLLLERWRLPLNLVALLVGGAAAVGLGSAMESLLFEMISLGFVLLSIGLLTGFLYLDDMFAQHLVHKTILSILAWLVFGIMLFGRWRYGWRGSLAVRMTLAGVALLVLSYFGTKLVLEVILGRSWQS